MSINLKSELSLNLKAMTYDMQFKNLDEKKEIIERYVQNLLDMLHENYGQVLEQDECKNDDKCESYSRYIELFGTAEKAAWTMTKVYVACQLENGHCDVCPLFDSVADNCYYMRDYDALLKWLRDDA